MERQAKDGTIYKMVGQDEWAPVTRSAKDGTVYQKVGNDEWRPLKNSQNLVSEKTKVSESKNSFGDKVMSVVEPVLTAVDYTYAPIRQALAAPAKIAQGNVSGALFDPIAQLARSPKTAPTSSEVAEMYGVPKERKVAPIVMSNPLYGSTYEADPLPEDDQNVTIYPSQQVGAIIDTAVGGEGIKLIGKGAKSVKNIAPKLSKFAEKTAVNATGATGVQSSKFADDAGRQLLDRKIVRFGDNQKKISERAQKAVDAANLQIDEALTKLEKQGVTVDADAIKSVLKEKISTLSKDPSQSDVVRMLKSELENLDVSTDLKGTNKFTVKESEQIKRGFNRKAGNWADPEKSQAGKEMYQTFRRATEDAAVAADPTTAKAFKEGKETYGILTPIQEAAERRSATTSQSPLGGLMDVSTAIGGAAAGDPTFGLASVVARRTLAPRMASSIAVSADKIANVLRKTPQLSNLEKSNPGAFQAMVQQVLNSESKVATLPAKAAENENPKKGPDKWANDGAEKLLKTDASISPELINELKKSKQGKDLLIRASDLRPGSEQMNKLILKIKTSYLQGGE